VNSLTISFLGFVVLKRRHCQYLHVTSKGRFTGVVILQAAMYVRSGGISEQDGSEQCPKFLTCNTHRQWIQSSVQGPNVMNCSKVKLEKKTVNLKIFAFET
ncbi:hypothetical protein C0J52_22920, partial [Blattella germanica]